MKRSISNQWKVLALIAGAASLAAGCGSGSSSTAPGTAPGPTPIRATTTTNPVVAAAPVTPPPPTAVGTAPSSSNIAAIPSAAVAAMLGTYVGTFVSGKNADGESYSQNFTITFGKQDVTVQGQPAQSYATLSIQSNGQSYEGTANSSSQAAAYASVGLRSYTVPGANVYSFVSQAINVQGLSPYLVAIEMVITLKDGTTFDPSNSAIFIKDCGFSQGYGACSNTIWESSVNLIKR